MSFDVKDPSALRRSIKKWRAVARKATHLVRRRKRQLAAALKPKVPAVVGSGWHPHAQAVPYSSAGSFISAGAKIVWHTTEGVGLPSYNGTAPHFTFDPKTGKLYQHIPITQAAKALIHPPACETNRAHAVQVELMLFSDAAYARKIGHADRAVENLTDADYARIAELARWIEKYAGVPRRCGVTFDVPAKRLSPGAWLSYAGHCGHEHVPGNFHWDPAKLNIRKVLA